MAGIFAFYIFKFYSTLGDRRDRQYHAYRRPFMYLGFHFDLAAVDLGDIVANGKP
jgi:hypothetical protein